ncbi:replicative DNA helicase [Rhodoflexus sp.]
MKDDKSTGRKTRRITQQPDLAMVAMGKMPPQALDLEEAVLGALMLERNALTEVIEILQPSAFYKEAHQAIYRAILALFNKSEPVDLLTVVTQLRSEGELELAGGAAYITLLTTKVNSAANIVYHARIIAERYMKREMINIAGRLLQDAFEETTDVFELMDRTENAIFGLAETNIRRNYQDMRSIMGSALRELEAKKAHKDGLTGVPSGFSALDRITSGWQRSDLIVLAARPGMGKCLGKGTEVLMYDGSLRRVEEIAVGDLLMGPDSTPRRVLSIGRGREQMYWIHQNKGISYRVNESHLLSLKRSRNEGKHRKGDVLTISVREWLKKSPKFQSNYKGYKTAVEFSEKAVPLAPYFLGLWLGDGNCANMRITNQDPEIVAYLEQYAALLSLEVSVGAQVQKTPQYAITKGAQGAQYFYSVQNELRKLTLFNNKHIPQAYLTNSRAQRLQLLAGLIDSSGYYDTGANYYEITQKNKVLAEQIKFLADSLGLRTSLKAKKARPGSSDDETTLYRLRMWGNLDEVPVRVPRKKARAWAAKLDWKVTSIRVEKDIVDDYYGFELDGDRLFLLADMTVTHNTAFVLSALRNAAVDFSKPVAIFSLEMSSVQLVNRLISAEAELESQKLKTGRLADYEWEQIVHKTARLSAAPIFIDDTPALTVLELRAKARRLKSQHDIQLIIIDYLQLMSGESSKNSGGNREQEIAAISRALKQLAKELDIPVIALSQLSRAVETRGGDKRPQLSDLRESGAIEQDADMVIFLYRPEYYGITEDADGKPTKGLGEVIIAKNRNGSLESVWLKFLGRYTKFSDLDSADFDTFGGGNFQQAGSGTYGSAMGQYRPQDFNSPLGGTLSSKANDLPPPDDVPF